MSDRLPQMIMVVAFLSFRCQNPTVAHSTDYSNCGMYESLQCKSSLLAQITNNIIIIVIRSFVVTL